MTSRDEFRERRFLTAAGAGHTPFIDQAVARLDAGEERFGSSWAWIGIRRHVAELLEEAADLGCWAVLADQALDHEAGISVEHHDQIRDALQRAATLGAAAHRVLSDAANAIEADR